MILRDEISLAIREIITEDFAGRDALIPTLWGYLRAKKLLKNWEYADFATQAQKILEKLDRVGSLYHYVPSKNDILDPPLGMLEGKFDPTVPVKIGDVLNHKKRRLVEIFHSETREFLGVVPRANLYQRPCKGDEWRKFVAAADWYKKTKAKMEREEFAAKYREKRIRKDRQYQRVI